MPDNPTTILPPPTQYPVSVTVPFTLTLTLQDVSDYEYWFNPTTHALSTGAGADLLDTLAYEYTNPIEAVNGLTEEDYKRALSDEASI